MISSFKPALYEKNCCLFDVPTGGNQKDGVPLLQNVSPSGNLKIALLLMIISHKDVLIHEARNGVNGFDTDRRAS